MIAMMTEEYGFAPEDMERDYKVKYDDTESGKTKTQKVDLAIFNAGPGQTHQNYSDKNCNISNCKALIINALDLFMLDIFRIFIV